MSDAIPDNRIVRLQFRQRAQDFNGLVMLLAFAETYGQIQQQLRISSVVGAHHLQHAGGGGGVSGQIKVVGKLKHKRQRLFGGVLVQIGKNGIDRLLPFFIQPEIVRSSIPALRGSLPLCLFLCKRVHIVMIVLLNPEYCMDFTGFGLAGPAGSG